MDIRIPRGVPAGVNVVAILTMLNAVVLMVLTYVLWSLNFSGFAFASPGESITLNTTNIHILFPPVFAIFSAIAASVLLTGFRPRKLYYIMIAYWLVLFTYFAYYESNTFTTYYNTLVQLITGSSVNWDTYGGLYPFIGRGLAYSAPFIYSLGCIGYFLSRYPKKYFCIK